MAKVTLRDNETIDDLLKRFKTQVKKSGILDDVKKHEFFRNKATARKEKAELARRRTKQGY